MKKLLVICLFCFLSVSACKSETDQYISGTYIGEAEGYTSTLKVKVTVDEKNITQIEILENQEPKILADIVMATIPKKVIKKNSTEVDIVAGATYTSKNLLKAIDNALEAAKINQQ